MRALVLISSLPTGGAERVTVSFLLQLAARGRAVPLCTLTRRHDGPLAAELSAAGVARYDLASRRLADLRAPARLLALLRRERIDLVHAHGQDAAVVAALIRPLAPCRLVITRHVLEEPAATRRQRWRARGALQACRHADAVVAVSHAAAERLGQLARIPVTAIHVVPNGIELERFDPIRGQQRRPAVRRELGIGRHEPVVLMPAVLRPGKGHDVLLDAANTLRARHPGLRVLLAGDGELLDVLRRHPVTRGDTVVFLGRRTDMPDLMAASDVVVLPSLAEALPTALMEAAASARPVVATSVGGTPEVVSEGETGLLVPPSEPRLLADAISTLLSDRSRAAALGAAAHARARDRFGIEHQVERTRALWEQVAESRPR